MPEKRRFIILAVIMMVLVLITGAISIVGLYNTALTDGRARLVETVQSQARLIEAIAGPDSGHPELIINGVQTDKSSFATLSNIIDAYKQHEGFCSIGEFTLAWLDADTIRFLLNHQHADLSPPVPLSANTELAEAMRRALSGQSGTLIGPDFRGEQVLAAFMPVAIHDLGIVAKVDMTEIRAPFANSAFTVAIVAIILVVLGSISFFKISAPILESIRDQEERYQTLVETMHEGLAVVDNDGNYQYVNPAFCEMLGYQEEDLLGQSISATLDKQNLRVVRLQFDDRRKGLTEPYEAELTAKNGDQISTLISPGVIYDRNDKMTGSFGIVTDITEQKLADDLLRNNEERLRNLTSITPTYIYEIDAAGVILFANRTFVGLTREDIEGSQLESWFPDEIKAKIKTTLDRVLSTGQSQNIEYTIPKPDGELVTYSVDVSSHQIGNRPPTVIWTSTDITEQTESEKRIRDSEKQLRGLSSHLVEIREKERADISREIHDELGQHLTALNMDIAWLKSHLTKDQISLDNKADAMTELTSSMIATVKSISSRLRPSLLDDFGIVSALESEVSEWRKHLDINYQLIFEPDEIILNQDYSTAIYRICQEALTNIVRHAQASNAKVSLRVLNNEVLLEISDDGIGITKEQIKGTDSFGLIGMRERIKQYNGTLKIKGSADMGTTIEIKIPIHQV